mgnify:CR=1 FL=1
MELRLEHLVKDFSGTKAVNDVSITIQDGKLTGLLGPSGCGKSTTLYLISGLESPTSGRIFFGDRDVTALPPEKRGIGLVFQNYALYPHMTVYGNMAYALKIRKVPKREIDKRVHEVARILEIEHLLDRRPGELSGGQRQALTLLMATMVTPKILLLDEHTAALDPATAKKVLDLTRQIVAERKITCLMVTHNMHQALELGNRTLMMDSGKIILDVSGEKRAGMTVEDLLEQFAVCAGKRLDNDRILFSQAQ